jgi:hypothetical protein
MFCDKIHGKPTRTKRVETDCRDGAYYSVAQQGLGSYFTDREGLIVPESKRIIPQRQSDTFEWRASKRCMSEPGSRHYEKPEGLKTVEKPPPQIFSIREKRHIRQHSSKEEWSDRPVGAKTVFRENGYRAADQIAHEIDLTNEMQRKQHIQDLGGKRNGIGCKVLGDKNYRHPDYEPGFHHAGGLIIGSTFQRGSHKKTEARNATSIKLAVGGKKTMKSYEETQREREREEERQEVANLTKSIAQQGANFDSWETYALKKCATANYQDEWDDLDLS